MVTQRIGIGELLSSGVSIIKGRALWLSILFMALGSLIPTCRTSRGP